MPILSDIVDHDLLGPFILQGRQELLPRQLEKRFGYIPVWAQRRLATSLSSAELDEIGVRMLVASSLADLFSSA